MAAILSAHNHQNASFQHLGCDRERLERVNIPAEEMEYRVIMLWPRKPILHLQSCSGGMPAGLSQHPGSYKFAVPFPLAG